MNRILLMVCVFAVLLSVAIAEEDGQNTPEDTSAKIVSIAAGDDFSFAIDDKGFVWAWGLNDAAQLGVGDMKNRYTPTKIDGLENVTYISAGLNHAFAMDKKKNLYGWGDNSCGQLGLDLKKYSVVMRPEKLSKCGFPKDIVQIECGQYTSLILTKKGDVWALGKNEQRQIALLGSLVVTQPERISALRKISHIGLGYDHGIAVDDNLDTWTWGNDCAGQLGRPEFTQDPLRAIASADAKTILQGALCYAGSQHSHLIAPDGQVWSCGSNKCGELGNGGTGDVQVFIPLPVISGTAIKLSTRANFVMALTAEGQVWQWGNNKFSQIGSASKSNATSPVLLKLPVLASDIAAGRYHSLALTVDGKVYAIGNNASGQCADNSRISIPEPIEVRFE